MVLAYRLAAEAARRLPAALIGPLSAAIGVAGIVAMPHARRMAARHLCRVRGENPPSRSAQWAVRRTLASYGRYWLESFRLPYRNDDEIDDGHDVVGFGNIADALKAGRGVILALPHLGGWEWSAFWLARIEHLQVTAVVEPVEPPELFAWFVAFRQSLGMNIVPLGPDAGRAVLAALRRNEVVCLLADRDLAGNGVDVTFFGERTTLPAGPATLSLRSGAPILPTAVYFKPHGHLAVVQPPVDTARGGSLREDIARVTQSLATEFERLIAAAPEQWHLLQPNWPSDPGFGNHVVGAPKD